MRADMESLVIAYSSPSFPWPWIIVSAYVLGIDAVGIQVGYSVIIAFQAE